jgi:hypothetical protein
LTVAGIAPKIRFSCDSLARFGYPGRDTGRIHSSSWTPLSGVVATREGGVCRVAEVKIQEGESIESALRRFKRKVQQEDIIKDIKKHSFYL